MKKIHFICVGNVYRSRLAEAYFNFCEVAGIKAISSGIHAQNDSAGPICWYSERIILNNALVSFMSAHWKQTTRYLLETSDLNIFMDQSVFDVARNSLGYFGTNYRVWDIPDFECKSHKDPKDAEAYDIKLMEKSEATYILIKQNIKDLIEELRMSQDPFR